MKESALNLFSPHIVPYHIAYKYTNTYLKNLYSNYNCYDENNNDKYYGMLI